MVKSRILKESHASASRLNKAGFLSDKAMREFDALCQPTHVEQMGAFEIVLQEDQEVLRDLSKR